MVEHPCVHIITQANRIVIPSLRFLHLFYVAIFYVAPNLDSRDPPRESVLFSEPKTINIVQPSGGLC